MSHVVFTFLSTTNYLQAVASALLIQAAWLGFSARRRERLLLRQKVPPIPAQLPQMQSPNPEMQSPAPGAISQNPPVSAIASSRV